MEEDGVASAGDGDGVHIVLAVLITTPLRTGRMGNAGCDDEEEDGGTGEEDGLTRCVTGDGERERDESDGNASVGDGECGSVWCEEKVDDDCEAVDCERVERVDESFGRKGCEFSFSSVLR